MHSSASTTDNKVVTEALAWCRCLGCLDKHDLCAFYRGNSGSVLWWHLHREKRINCSAPETGLRKLVWSSGMYSTWLASIWTKVLESTSAHLSILKMSHGFALWNLWDNCKMTWTAAHLHYTIILVVTNVALGGGSVVLGTSQNSLSPTPLDLGPSGTRTLNWLNDWSEVFHHPNVPWALRLAWLFDFPNLLNCLFYSLRKVWTGLFAILYCGSCGFLFLFFSTRFFLFSM